MDEAEKYQQRVQAIEDKRRKQQDDEKARREMEEEWLTQAQRKRKSLRDQWLSENPQPVPGRSAENYTEELPTEEDIVEVIESTSYTVTNAQNHSQADIEEGGIQDIIRAAGGQLPGPVMERVLHENGLEGRSVLGMVAVQVERDSKTGVTKIRSVVPVSGAPRALGETVFNDSRKSVHHVGGAEGQPSAEELGQLLSVLNDVGMQVLLDEIPVVPQQKAEEKIEVGGGMEEEVDNVEDPATPTSLGYTEEEVEVVEHEDDEMDEEVEIGVVEIVEGPTRLTDLGYAEEKVEDLGCEDDEMDKETGVGQVDLVEGTVTLTFLGYTEVKSEREGLGHEDDRELVEVERVIISDAGEEEIVLQSPVLGSETEPFLGYTEQKVEAVGHEDDEEDVSGLVVFVEGPVPPVILGYTQEEVEDLGHENDPPRPTPRYRAEETGKRASKHNTKCCSIM
ncbi:paralemmin-1 [Oncorhynchus tshawytscha]|uniref:paralemmin-1 n=1 Tax=Oncorhynchus tshawytscha TaxID=74940 RepID=UPI000D0A46BE|nr:paralemmin-1 [Oncorhynchus tshawytscha]